MERESASKLTALFSQAVEFARVEAEREGAQVLWPHGLSSNTMALITSDCGAMRVLSTKWP